MRLAAQRLQLALQAQDLLVHLLGELFLGDQRVAQRRELLLGGEAPRALALEEPCRPAHLVLELGQAHPVRVRRADARIGVGKVLLELGAAHLGLAQRAAQRVELLLGRALGGDGLALGLEAPLLLGVLALQRPAEHPLALSELPCELSALGGDLGETLLGLGDLPLELDHRALGDRRALLQRLLGQLGAARAALRQDRGVHDVALLRRLVGSGH